MLFAILFGLSMDYNVFLLSRIHEAYNEGDGPRESVVHGMARIGKVILFAGLIMAAVFLAFVTQAGRDREDDRPRPRPGDPDRRAARAARHRARGGDAARRPGVVAAALAGPDPARTSRSRGTSCGASTSGRVSRSRSRRRPAAAADERQREVGEPAGAVVRRAHQARMRGPSPTTMSAVRRRLRYVRIWGLTGTTMRPGPTRALTFAGATAALRPRARATPRAGRARGRRRG